MATYIARRLAIMVPLLIGITFVTFLVSHLTPGDPILANLGPRAQYDPQIVAQYRQRWGLDKPFLVQYYVYLGNLVRGDLGRSITTDHPVRDDLRQFFPATLELATAAVVIAVAGGLVFGFVIVVFRRTFLKDLLDAMALVGSSVPVFWLGLLGLSWLYYRLGWLPGTGELDPALAPPPYTTGMYAVDALIAGQWATFRNAVAHLVLPSLSLSVYWVGVFARVVGSSLFEVLQSDYVRTARSKGLGESAVLLRHAFRNVLIPVVTMLGLAYGGLLSGAVLTEAIFSWPGVGQYAYRAAQFFDFPAIMGVTLVVSVLYVVVNLLVDVSYAFINPQVRYQ